MAWASAVLRWGVRSGPRPGAVAPGAGR